LRFFAWVGGADVAAREADWGIMSPHVADDALYRVCTRVEEPVDSDR
jgi:hypothetical protein